MMAPISLDPNSDVLIRVIQRGPVSFKQTEFRVLAAALSASPYWKSFINHMDGSSGFKPNKTHIEDTGITIVAVEISLRGLHWFYHRRQSHSDGRNNTMESNTEKEVKDVPEDDHLGLFHDLNDMGVYFPHELSRATIDDIWGLLALLNLEVDDDKHQGKFGVDWALLRPWFLEWRKNAITTFKTKADFEKLLFPTYAFRDSEGFRQTAKWLCQHTSVGNIEEYSPLVHGQKTRWYLHLHLPKGAISWVRIARSKLRTDVGNAIWSIVRDAYGWLSDAKCDCWVVAQYNYLEGLRKAGVLCPELNRRKTVMELVDLMKTTKYVEPLDRCLKCSKANVTKHLRSAIQIALDCEVVFTRDLPALLSEKPKVFQKKRHEKLPRRPINNGRN